MATRLSDASIDFSSMSAGQKKPTVVDWLFRLIGLLAVIFLGLLLVDLFVIAREPFNPTIAPFPLRLVVGVFAGASGILVSNIILWRVPGNPVGRLLLLWTIGLVGYQFSYNFGSSTLNETTFFLFSLYFGGIALTSLVLLLFYFPNGKVYPEGLAWFVPVYIAVRIAGAALAVASTNPSQYGHGENPFAIAGLGDFEATLAATVGFNGGLTFVIGLLIGTFSLFKRYRMADLVERQQIKWFAWAGTIIAASVTLFVGLHLLVFGGFSQLVPYLDFPFFVLIAVLPPLAVGAAVLRYGLWDVNFLISRTVLYVVLTAILAAVFAASAAAINQVASSLFQTETSAPAALVSTVLIVAIFQPVRREVEQWINERYFPENRELSRDFLEFSGEFRSVMTEEEMMGMIVSRICSLMSAQWGCIYTRVEGGRFVPSSAWKLEVDQEEFLALPERMVTSWGAANAVRVPDGGDLSVLAPLYIARVKDDYIVGILGLGPRDGGQGYSRNDLRELTKFGGEAGKVLYSYEFRAQRKAS